MNNKMFTQRSIWLLLIPVLLLGLTACDSGISDPADLTQEKALNAFHTTPVVRLAASEFTEDHESLSTLLNQVAVNGEKVMAAVNDRLAKSSQEKECFQDIAEVGSVRFVVEEIDLSGIAEEQYLFCVHPYVSYDGKATKPGSKTYFALDPDMFYLEEDDTGKPIYPVSFPAIPLGGEGDPITITLERQGVSLEDINLMILAPETIFTEEHLAAARAQLEGLRAEEDQYTGASKGQGVFATTEYLGLNAIWVSSSYTEESDGYMELESILDWDNGYTQPGYPPNIQRWFNKQTSYYFDNGHTTVGDDGRTYSSIPDVDRMNQWYYFTSIYTSGLGTVSDFPLSDLPTYGYHDFILTENDKSAGRHRHRDYFNPQYPNQQYIDLDDTSPSKTTIGTVIFADANSSKSDDPIGDSGLTHITETNVHRLISSGQTWTTSSTHTRYKLKRINR